MPNYQLPEIPGGDVYVPCTFSEAVFFVNTENGALPLRPIPVTPVKEVEVSEAAEELWDEFSQLIGSDISDLDYFAGRTVITESEFKKALSKYAASLKEKGGEG